MTVHRIRAGFTNPAGVFVHRSFPLTPEGFRDLRAFGELAKAEGCPFGQYRCESLFEVTFHATPRTSARTGHQYVEWHDGGRCTLWHPSGVTMGFVNRQGVKAAAEVRFDPVTFISIEPTPSGRSLLRYLLMEARREGKTLRRDEFYTSAFGIPVLVPSKM